MSTDTQIANLALLRIGVAQQLVDADTDTSVAALAVQLIYDAERDFVLRDFPWPFATSYVTLDLWTGSPSSPANGDWIYAYEYPLCCLFMRRLVTALGRDETNPPPFRIGRNPAFSDAIAWDSATAYDVDDLATLGGVTYRCILSSTNNTPPNGTYWAAIEAQLIFTNEASAQMEATTKITDDTEFDAVFVSMFAWRLAAQLALSLSRMPDMAKSCLEMYAAEKAQAVESAVREGQQKIATGDVTDRVREIVQAAVMKMGVKKSVAGIDAELTLEALWPKFNFADERDFVLRDFPWPFARKYVALTLAYGDGTTPVNDDWMFAYRYPADCIFVRRITIPNAIRGTFLDHRDPRWWNPPPTPYAVGRDDAIALASAWSSATAYVANDLVTFTDGLTYQCVLANTNTTPPNLTYWAPVLDPRLIFCSVPTATIEYTVQITDPTEFDAVFVSMLAWRIAAILSPGLAKDPKAPEKCLAMYQYELNKAQVRAMNEGQSDEPPDCEWVSGR